MTDSVCEKYRSELSALMDGQLAVSLKTEVESHLGDCSDCSDELTTLKSLTSLLTSEFQKEPDDLPDLWAAMQDSIPSVCDVMQEDLSAYLDGELPAPAQEGVNIHLKECPPCLESFRLLNASNRLIAQGLELPTSVKVDLWPAVKVRINEDCALIQGEISAYIDQEVPSQRHRTITQHLTECQSCRDSFTNLSAVGDLVREHYKPILPENLDLWPEVKSQLQVVPFQAKTTAHNNKPKEKVVVPRRFMALGASAAVVVGLAGVVAVWLTSPQTASLQPITSEAYLIESSLTEPADVAEAALYEQD